MRHVTLITEVLSTPWALMPERMAAFGRILARWQAGGQIPETVVVEVAADTDARTAKRSASVAAGGGGIAVLPMYGVITQRGNMIDALSGPGSVSTEIFAKDLDALVKDDAVGQILIDVDSPGGTVYGVGELAAKIRAARADKPIVAIANSLAASAAYWLASQASEVYVTPGGEVGSIGVWSAHDDVSKAMEKLGVTTTLISAGKFKIEGNPYAPLDEEARAFMQSRVDDYYAAFTGAVAAGRGVPIAQVRDGMGQGRVLGADAAKAAAMVDGVMTFDEVVAKMKRAARQAAKPAGASKLAQARRELQILG